MDLKGNLQAIQNLQEFVTMFQTPIEVFTSWLLAEIVGSVSPSPNRISFLRFEDEKAVYVMGYGRRIPLAGRILELPRDIMEVKPGRVLVRPTPNVGYDVYVGVTTLQQERGLDGKVLPNGKTFEERGIIAIDDIDRARVFTLKEVAILEACAELFANALTLKRESIAFQRMAETDGMTGLPNYRAIIDRLNKLARSALISGEKLTVALIDIDNFKQVNDKYGHPFGDRVLRRIADHLHDLTIGRYGGEEFLILIPEHIDRATEIMNEKREQWMRIMWPGKGSFCSTFSAGLCEISPQHSRQMTEWVAEHSAEIDPLLLGELGKEPDHQRWQEDLAEQAASLAVQVADHRLYFAKGAGRNLCIGENGIG